SLPGRGPSPALLRSVGPLPHAVRHTGDVTRRGPGDAAGALDAIGEARCSATRLIVRPPAPVTPTRELGPATYAFSVDRGRGPARIARPDHVRPRSPTRRSPGRRGRPTSWRRGTTSRRAGRGAG